MVKDKGYIILDPDNDKLLLNIFNDLIKKPLVVYDYKGKKDKWGSISRKIGLKCKDLFDEENPLNGLMLPTSSARYHNLGFVTRPMKVEIAINPFKNKKKVLFNRKLF